MRALVAGFLLCAGLVAPIRPQGQEPAVDTAARAATLVIPLQAKGSEKAHWLSGTVVHASGRTAVVAASSKGFKYKGIDLSSATVKALVAGRTVPATAAGRLESWGLAFFLIEADGLPPSPEFVEDPRAGLAPATARKFKAGGLKGGDGDKNPEIGVPIDLELRSFGPVSQDDFHAQGMQVTGPSSETNHVGGPLIDPEGRMAGLIIENTGGNPRSQGYSTVSGATLEAAMSGWVGVWKAEIAVRNEKECRVRIEGSMCNPLGRVLEVRAAHFFEKVQDPHNGPHPNLLDPMTIGPSKPLMNEPPLTVQADRFSGEISVESASVEGGRDCVIQIRLVRRGGFSRYSRPKFVKPEFAARSPVPAAADDDWMASDESRKREDGGMTGKLVLKKLVNVDATFSQIDLPAADIVFNPIWSDDGKALFTLEKKGLLRKIAVPSFQEENRLELGFECLSLHMSRIGLLALGKDHPELCVVDPTTVQVKKRIKIFASSSLASSPKSLLAYAAIAKEGLPSTDLQIVDLAAGSVVYTQNSQLTYQEIRGDEAQSTLNWSRLSLSPDGRVLLSLGFSHQLHRLRSSGTRLILEESLGINATWSDDNQLVWSPDSMYFAVPHRASDDREMLVFKTHDLKSRLFALKAAGWWSGFGFDPAAQAMYGPGRSKPLAVYDSTGASRKEYTIWPKTQDGVRLLVVHPEGRRALAVSRNIVVWVEFPQ